jgi:hypothetical protein
VWNVLAWYALGFMAAPLAVVYLKFSGDRSLWQSLLYGHLFAFFSFVWFLAAIAACWNVMLGRRVWLKTSRVATEPEATLLSPTETADTPNEEEVVAEGSDVAEGGVAGSAPGRERLRRISQRRSPSGWRGAQR